MKTRLLPALLLCATTLAAGTSDYSRLFDLSEIETRLDAEVIAKLPPRICGQTVVLRRPSYADIHRVAIDGEENAKLRDALARLPGITVVPKDDAQLLIEYSESLSEEEGELTWEARIFRLKCQDDSTEPPCASRVYVRTDHDTMSGTVTAGRLAIGDFADELREALLTPVPPEASPNPSRSPRSPHRATSSLP